jgi:hypothetical protein
MKAGEPLEPAVEIFANILREEVKRRADFLPEHVG